MSALSSLVVDAYNKKKIDGEVCGTLTAHGNTSSTHCGTFLIKEDLPKTAIQKVGQISNEGSQCGTVVSDEGLSPTLSAGTHGYANAHVCTKYRIRKLTEKECFRLMGFKDSDFEKARAVNSATQIYKQSGNSIVKQVLMAIFLQMNIQGLKPWNNRNEDEIRELIK